jgi:hypothetical protein
MAEPLSGGTKTQCSRQPLDRYQDVAGDDPVDEAGQSALRIS